MRKLNQRVAWLVTVFVQLTLSGFSQERLYIAHGNEVGYVNLLDFSYTYVATTPNFLDIAITPDGKLYGITGTELYEVNLTTGNSTNIPLNFGSSYFYGGNSMVSDRNGDLFVTGFGTTLFKIEMQTREVVMVGGISHTAAGDLCFYEGKLYMAADGNGLVEIALDPSGNSVLSSRLVGTMNLTGTVYSIGSDQNGVCYVITTAGELALIDLNDASTYIICNPVHGPTNAVWGIAMQNEGANDKAIEICGNGLDDDNNGYIDDNDMACRLKRGVCNTDGGKEIYRESFGTGGGYGAALPELAGNAAYKFSSTAPLAEGFYTIVDNPRTAIGNTTWKNITDHSGQAGGRMMVINASATPGEFYRKSISGLCGGLQYAITVSACSIISADMQCGSGVVSIPSRIRFRIEDANGQILGQLAEQYIPADPAAAAGWKEYGLVFTLPENLDAIQVVLLNDAPGGCGNDLAVDDLTLSVCKPLLNVQINGDANTPPAGCINTAVSLRVDADQLNLQQPVFQWQKFQPATSTWTDVQTGSSASYTVQKLQPADAGQYRVLVAENVPPACRKEAISNIVDLQVLPDPVLTVAPSFTVCEGEPLQLQASAGAALQEAIWTYPSGDRSWDLSPLVTSATNDSHKGNYVLNVKTADGCVGSITTVVNIRERAPVDFSFSANPVCTGQQVQVRAGSANAVTQWQWTAAGAPAIQQGNTATPLITWDQAGNYLLSLRATGDCVVTDPVTHDVTVEGSPALGTLTVPEHVCIGSTLELSITGYSNGDLHWDISGNPRRAGTADRPSLQWDEPGTYTISYSIDGTCGTAKLATPLPVTVHEQPAVSLGEDTAICFGQQIVLQPVYGPDVTQFSWQGGPFTPQPRYGLRNGGQYSVTVQDRWGCESKDDILVQEKNCGCIIIMPTAFSPNRDGRHDIFRPVVRCILAKYQFRVYNRWGQLVFSTTTPGEGWNGILANGRTAELGAYVWVVDYLSYEYPNALQQTGSVLLIK